VLRENPSNVLGAKGESTAKQVVYFRERWKGRSRSDGAALQSGYCICEPQRLFYREPRKQSVNKSAVKSIAGSGCVFAINCEGGRVNEPTMEVSQHSVLAKRRGYEYRTGPVL
jgi:hypothetical protein